MPISSARRASEDSEHSQRPIYDEFIRGQEKRIVWYRFPKTLPQVDGANVPYAPKPQGEKPSPQTIIGVSDPKTSSSHQLIWRPDRPPSIKTEIESPNLIALGPEQQVQPPAPKPKQFMPPPVREVQAPAPPPKPAQLDAPNIDIAMAAGGSTWLPRARQFVAPPPKERVVEAAPSIAADPSINVNASPDDRGLGVLRQARAAAPPPPSRLTALIPGGSSSGPPGPGGGGASQASGSGGQQPGSGSRSDSGPAAGVSAAIVGLTPSSRMGDLPDGSRPGRFSTAPNVGPPGAPANGGGGIYVPGLHVEGAPGSAAGATSGSASAARPAGLPSPAKAVLYRETIAAPLPSTFSAPLHPSSRSIPQLIESRFHNRTVYALIIPAPALPEYGGDWTLWFAERVGEPGGSRIRAPLPYRKLQSPTATRGAKAGQRFQIAVIIARNGIVQPIDPTSGSELAIEDLRCWEFQPAMRNGSPVDVEAVLEFVFRGGP